MITDSASSVFPPVPAQYPVFDGHNDLAWAIRQQFGSDVAAAALGAHQPALHTDIARLRRGGVAAQFWSVFVPSTLESDAAVVATLEQLDCVQRVVESFPGALQFAQTAAEVRLAREAGLIASLVGVEGGHSIASSLGVLRALRRAGVRYLTLTHNGNTPWAASATGDPVGYGLNDFGRTVVRELNRTGIIVDLSHVSERTMHDALDSTLAPVIFSHSSCRAVTDHPRNVPDSVLARLAGNDGVLMLTFVPFFVSDACARHELESEEIRKSIGLRVGFHHESPDDPPAAVAEYKRWQAKNPQPQASIADVVRHIEYARETVGVRHIGLGSDFDGVDVVPEGLEDVASYPRLFSALSDRGWSDHDLRALGFDNVLRVLDAAEHVAADLGWH